MVFGLNGGFLKRKCVIFGLDQGFLKRKCIIFGLHGGFPEMVDFPRENV
ncbi:Uncharacterised protein [Chlamydia abortus]|nr:Uncharacterised protein [Chlamydia abortus]SFW06282.1 Uncharacterised protein [Chlamydia abortus]